MSNDTQQIVKPIKPPTAPVVIDGWLYVGVAICGALQLSFGSDDAAKFMEPENLFWLRAANGAVSAGLLALKLYRSQAYAHHQAEKKKTAETAFLHRP